MKLFLINPGCGSCEDTQLSEDQVQRHSKELRVGVDSGGTFTDVCIFDQSSGEVLVWKVPSTPHDPSEGIVTSISQALQEAQNDEHVQCDVSYFGHGTTVGTNALLTGRGADTGLITTEGFRDVLEIGRQKRPDLYDLQTTKPPVLVSRDKRLEVKERILFDGTVETTLDEEQVRTAIRRLKQENIGAVAICTLFSFLDPTHEARIREIVEKEYPDVFVSVSHEIAPEFREYERFSTTVVNAYLGPIMNAYLNKLAPRLAAIGVDAKPHLTQSNGGVISCDTAKMQPVRTVLSGPAAGVMAAAYIGETTGHNNLITFDMGGTSSDVSLIADGRPQMANDTVVHGYPLKVPMLDIHTVGAGGGSIAYVDNGLLKVGPRSAGAAPGPVCYGLGNKEPTVTDANVVLGVLNQTHLLNGRMSIDAKASFVAMERLAKELEISVMDAAQGIIRVVIANMAKAIRVISVERGYDPRDYVMLAFGGAGPIHAARLAEELDIPRIMIPKHPGIMCAVGLLQSDLRTDLAITRMVRLEESALDALNSGFDQLNARAEEWFVNEEIPSANKLVNRAVDMRYGGQGYELTIDWPKDAAPSDVLDALRQNFEDAHRQLYGYVADEEPIQITTLRVEAIGTVPKVAFKKHAAASRDVADAIIGTRSLWLPEKASFADVALYDRDLLQPGHIVQGPAIIEQMDSTTLVLAKQIARVDDYLNLMIEAQ